MVTLSMTRNRNTTSSRSGSSSSSSIGKYEIGRTLGEGNFGKVKLCVNLETGKTFAVKIIDKSRINQLHVSDQIIREISTLKLLRHPNIVRLHEVLATVSKIYMVLEYVSGGELFDRIASKGKLSELQGRKVFQQLIDGLSYCHSKGVFHRDLKLENVLLDTKGNIKISDFGLSALPHHFRADGLLHTSCGSPNYVAPEILTNRGYDGATSDVWSCGVILYVILTGYLPFDDRNLSVLYHKILKSDTQIPIWLSSAARDILTRILDPNPVTRITVDEIKAHEWFRQGYVPALDVDNDDNDEKEEECHPIDNAFRLIGMSSCLDLSGFFENEDVSMRNVRFTSNHSDPKELMQRIEGIVVEMGFSVHKRNARLRIAKEHKGHKSPATLSVEAEVLEISPSLYVVELRKSSGDASVYRQLCQRLSSDLGVPTSQDLFTPPQQSSISSLD